MLFRRKIKAGAIILHRPRPATIANAMDDSIIAMRLFWARPASVELSATGC
jgi:hypothetical protein